MRRRLAPCLPIVLAVVAIACSSSKTTSNGYAPLYAPAGESMCLAPEGQACPVSIISLIARPEKFAGKKVMVVGFATFECEGNAVYACREAAEVRDNASATWLDIEGLTVPHPETLDRQYVLVAGTFDAENRGHIGMFAGTIKSISELQRAKQ